MSRLFISHSTADRAFVEAELAGLFKALGFEVWFAEEDIQTADRWERAIRRGLESSEWVVVVMSKRSSKSEWVKDEVAWAIEHRPSKLIPILINDCKPLDFHIHLPQIQHVDFRKVKKIAQEKLITLLVNEEYRPSKSNPYSSGDTSILKGKWYSYLPKEVTKGYPKRKVLNILELSPRGRITGAVGTESISKEIFAKSNARMDGTMKKIEVVDHKDGKPEIFAVVAFERLGLVVGHVEPKAKMERRAGMGFVFEVKGKGDEMHGAQVFYDIDGAETGTPIQKIDRKWYRKRPPEPGS
jgi:hypothetical protein